MKEIEFILLLDYQQFNRIRVRLKTVKGELTDVMYQYESFINKKWVELVRFDCAHGFFHRDIISPNGEKDKKTIEIDSLKSASRYAEHDLKNRWEWYKEQYNSKLNMK